MPNTQDNWQTTATIHDQHRAAVWGAIFPGARMPIKSVVPIQADLPGYQGAFAYMLDLQAITDQQMQQLIAQIADLFQMDPEEVRSDIDARGVPILADDTSVQSTDQGMMMALMDDDLPGLEEIHPTLAGVDDWQGELDQDLDDLGDDDD